MAEDRFPVSLSASMLATKALRLTPRAKAMSRSAVQNGASMDTLVGWPAIRTERFTTLSLTFGPHRTCGLLRAYSARRPWPHRRHQEERPWDDGCLQARCRRGDDLRGDAHRALR